MAEMDDAERTEDPTPQRREDFRNRGQVAQSREFSSVFVLLFSVIAFWLLGRFFLREVYEIFARSFTDFLTTSGRQGDWVPALKFAFTKAVLIVAPLGGLLWLLNVMSSVVQIGFLNSEEAMSFDLSRIDPIQGFQRLFALRSFIEGAKAIAKVILVGAIVYIIVQGEIKNIPQLSNYGSSQLILYCGRLMLKLFGWVGIFMAVLAGLDYIFQHWELEKQMRMTKQEIKEEIKSREGDPLVRARVRKLQRELANRRMMDAVKKADVIITNPTHIAVALQYSQELVAPKLIAKGADFMAEKIKAIAKEHKVPIVENKPLARTIYKTLKIGQIIPRELYTAVAEVLSYIYKLKRKRA